VDGVGHGDADWADFLRSPLVHLAAVLDALRFQPLADFIDPNHLAGVLFGKRHGIVDVIEVPMGNEDGIDPVEGMTGGVGRIADPGVKDNDLAGFQLKFEGTVAEPRDFQHCGRLILWNPDWVVIATGLRGKNRTYRAI
jgi:hypothetical protein